MWILRESAVHSAEYNLPDLREHDQRLEALVDGMRVMGEPAWHKAIAEMKWEQGGEMFALATLALESRDKSKWYQALELDINPDTGRGLVSAMGWQPLKTVRPLIQGFLKSSEAQLNLLALSTASVHRYSLDPVKISEMLASGSEDVQLRAIRLAGELKCIELLPQLKELLNSQNESTAVMAAWSVGILGDLAGREKLEGEITKTPESTMGNRALELLVRLLPRSEAVALIRDLIQSEDLLRTSIQATGHLGDPVSIPWLLEKMENPETARVAGQAFSIITGLDVSQPEFNVAAPEGFQDDGVNDDPEDPNVDLEQDADLAWPNVPAIRHWWSTNGSEFPKNTRWLSGKPVSLAGCQQTLRDGNQYERKMSAIEIALLEPTQILHEVRAPALRQQQLLTA